MRLITATLTFLMLTTLAAAVKADDTSKRSAELQVLERFNGAWEHEITIKPVGADAITAKGVDYRSWSRGGRILHFSNPAGEQEFHMSLTYDAKTKTYPGVMLIGASRHSVTGTWDAKTQTMSFVAKNVDDGGTYRGTYRFIGKERSEANGVLKNAEGEVVFERMETAKRTADETAPAAKAAKPDEPAKPAQKTRYEPTSHYTIKNMEGWKVYVNKALLPGGAHAEMGAKAIERLRGDMVLVKHWVADDPLAKLLKVGIWLELDTTNGPHGRTPVFHYHGYLGWLKRMDFHPGKHKCVEFSRAASLVQHRRGRGTAHILLHELSHAYHDQVLSFNDRDILAAHKRARTSGKYPKNDFILRLDHKEFFAHATTRYFGMKRERDALVERDPILLKKLQKVWGKPKAYMDSPPPKGKTSPGKPRSGGAQ